MQSLRDFRDPRPGGWQTSTTRIHARTDAAREWSPPDRHPLSLVLALRIERRQSAEVSLLRRQVAFAYEVLTALTEGHALQEVVRLARRGLLDEAYAELQRWRTTYHRDKQPGPELAGDDSPKRLEIPASGKAFLNNLKFLEENRNSLRGQWVALEDGVLLDQDSTLRSLHERLGQAGRLRRGVLVTKVY